MKKQLLVFFISLLVLPAVYGQSSEQSLVKEAFENYKSAILNEKGEEAVRFVNSKTVAYYDDILNKVKNADSAEVNGLSVLDKLMVFSIRHRTSRADILSFDGKALLVYAIKSGVVGKSSVINLSVGEIKTDGNYANGVVVTNGKATPLSFGFTKENGQWKIDLTSILPASAAAFEAMVKDSGQEENEFFFSILNILTGKTPGPEIWKPVR